MSFKQQFPLGEEYYIDITREYAHGGAWDNHIVLHVYQSSTSMEVAKLLLRSLEPLSYSGFAPTDFVQHGLRSVEPGKGHAHRMHDFLISHRAVLPFEIRNVYSTNPSTDNLYFVQPNQPRLYLSESAIRFWNKRIQQQKAEYVDELKRYRITWDT